MSDTFYRDAHEWMTDAQWECAVMIADVFGGFHHLKQRHKKGRWWIFEECGPDGVLYRDQRSLATYDFPELTNLVVMAHDRCIRVEISARMNWLETMAHKCDSRDGRLWKRHPTMAEAVERFSDKRTGEDANG